MTFPQEYPKMLAVAAIVCDEQGRVLLHKREKEPDQGKWQLFATYVKPGERLTDAVKRRLQEDAGITNVRSIEFTGKYYDAPGRHAGTYCIPFVFKVAVAADAASKMNDCAWFPKAEAVKLDLALDNQQVLSENL